MSDGAIFAMVGIRGRETTAKRHEFGLEHRCSLVRFSRPPLISQDRSPGLLAVRLPRAGKGTSWFNVADSLEELNRRGNHLVVSEEMIAKLRQTYVDFCRQRRQ